MDKLYLTREALYCAADSVEQMAADYILDVHAGKFSDAKIVAEHGKAIGHLCHETARRLLKVRRVLQLVVGRIESDG